MYYKSLFIMSQFINEIHYVTELLSEVISISVLNDIIIKYAVIKRESFDTCLYKEVNIHKMFVMENKLVTMTTDTCLRNMMCYTWHDNKLIDRQSQTHFHVVNIIDTTTWTCSNYWYF